MNEHPTLKQVEVTCMTTQMWKRSEEKEQVC